MVMLLCRPCAKLRRQCPSSAAATVAGSSVTGFWSALDTSSSAAWVYVLSECVLYSVYQMYTLEVCSLCHCSAAAVKCACKADFMSAFSVHHCSSIP